MKITSVDVVEIRHPLTKKAGPAAILNDSRGCLLVSIGTSDGVVGVGEGIPFAGVRDHIENAFAPRLIGRDPLEVQRTWKNPWLAPYQSALAVSAVDVALHDLWGKVLGVPVHQLYGGAFRHHVPAYASAGLYLEDVDPAEHWEAEARDLVDRGFMAIKFRIGRFDPDYEIPLIRRMRASVPADVRLMVDAWGSYTLPMALRVGRVLEELDYFWYEEPMSQYGYPAYEELTRALDIAIAGGENVQSRFEAKALFDRRAVDIVQPDVSLCGGIGEFLFIADLAALYGIRCIPHSWNSAVTAAASIQAASLLPETTLMPSVDIPLVEFDMSENLLIRELLVEPLHFHDGGFTVGDKPGLGIEIDQKFVDKYKVA